MERVSTAGYIRSILIGLGMLVLLLAAAYAGGYFLLPDDRGLFPSKAIFNIYMPALKLQRYVTKRYVFTGYRDGQGRRFQIVLPANPVPLTAPPPSLSPPGPGSAPAFGVGP
jgi:hypothetical protein